MALIFVTKQFNQSNRMNNSTFANARNLADVLEPTNGFEDMDVIKKFNWTLSPLNDTVVKEVPYIKLTEYYLLDNYLNQLFKTYGTTAQGAIDIAQAFLNPFTLEGSSTQLYQGLYDHANPSGFSYKFPYFSADYLNTSNSWTAKPMFQEITNLQKKIQGYGVALGVGAAAGAAGAILNLLQIQLPVDAIDLAKRSKRLAEREFQIRKFKEVVGIGLESPIANFEDPAIDKPHIWSTTTPRSFNVSFPLYNTLNQPKNKEWFANIVQNWELCHLLCYQNLYNKRNLFTGIPPVFYEIDIPGIHYSKAGYISNLQIMNVGNIRKLKLPLSRGLGLQDVNVPDAYFINMTVTDFFIPSKNFMSSLCQTNKGNLTQTFQGGRELAPPSNQPLPGVPPLPGQSQPTPQFPGVPYVPPQWAPAPTPVTPRPTD